MNLRLRRILIELGTLLGPTALVAYFCDLMGVDSKRAAVISLAVVLGLAGCMYKNWLNRKIPSTLVMALLLALSVVFFFNFQNILLKDTGLIKRLKSNAEVQAEVAVQIKSADQEIWMFGTNFYVSTVDDKKLLLERLRQGVKIRYLILDPYVTDMDRIARDFDQPESVVKDECVMGLRGILELKKMWAQIAPESTHPGEIEVKFFDTTPRSRLYVFDPGKESGRTLFIPYVNLVQSSTLPSYLLENSQSGVYSIYFGGIQKLWQNAQTLDVFLKTHPDFN